MDQVGYNIEISKGLVGMRYFRSLLIPINDIDLFMLQIFIM